MSKFNRTVTPRVAAPIQTKTRATGTTYQGAPGFERADAKSELFLLAVQNMVGEKTFYEDATARDARFQVLVREVAVKDPEWFASFVKWLRGPDANMRSASLVAAAEAVKARRDAGVQGGNRQIVNSVLQRADEPGEMLAYWINAYGRDIPQPIKRGVADAVQRLYNEYGTLKYDTQSASVRFGDVLALTHPDPVAPWQGELFSFINARRWKRDAEHRIGDSLTMIEARKLADSMSREALLADPDLLRVAGYTWENIAGKGEMDAAAWEAVIPNMGIFALLRNLRNFDKAGISREAQDQVRAKLTDPDVIAKSRLFPFRFLSAYQAVQSENWGRELETALQLSLQNVPKLTGRTLILVDRSGSMFAPAAGSLSDMSRADVAALFGVALAQRAEYADVVQFGSKYQHPTGYEKVTVQEGASALKLIDRFKEMGGTETETAVRANFRPGFHDRIVCVTDEQAWYHAQSDVFEVAGDKVPCYTWNLAGYRRGHAAGGKNRFTFGGLSDTSFRIVPLIEAGKNADWSAIFGS